MLLRTSLGRVDDNRPADWSDDEVDRAGLGGARRAHGGRAASPSSGLVARYHDALPQYRVHHLLRTAGVESALARLGGVAVAGSAYRGVGIPACIASGRAAATLSLL